MNEEDFYWEPLGLPEVGLPKGEVQPVSWHARWLSQYKVAQQTTDVLVGYFDWRRYSVLDAQTTVVVKTSLIRGAPAISLRAYASDVAISWLFSPSDAQTWELLDRWHEIGEIAISADFGVQGVTGTVVPFSLPDQISALRMAVTARNADASVRTLCEQASFASLDGILSSLAFLPMTFPVQDKLRHACLVGTPLVCKFFSDDGV